MAMSPIQSRNRGCILPLVVIIAVLVAIVLTAFSFPSLRNGIAGIFKGNTGTTPTPISTGIITTHGEQIGISDGTYAFDTNRIDGPLKSQAADKLKKRDVAGAQSLWQQAIQQDTNDAEVLIYQEDQQVLASGKPYITFVVGTMLTGSTSDVGTGRDDLQGAYVAQKEYNDGLKLNGGVQVRLLIANSGSQSDDASTVARQIVQLAKHDHSIVGVMGWPFSSQALNVVNILAQAHIPMVSPTASSDALTGVSHYFFRVAPSNNVQAIAGAKYAEQQLHAQRVALFVDSNNAYSASLAQDFRQQFTNDGNQIVATENYTVGKPVTLPGLLQNALSTNPAPQLIYFAGYASDMAVLLTDLPASQPNLQVMGGDALYELNGYSTSARAGFSRLHLTAFAYPDEWIYSNQSNPAFFTVYAHDFDPNRAHTANPYGYSRPDNDVILSYDAMLALLQGSNNALTGGKTSFSPEALRQGLAGITTSQPIQGISGQIAFGQNGDPVNKAIVVLYVDPDGHIKLPASNGIQGCFLIGQC